MAKKLGGGMPNKPSAGQATHTPLPFKSGGLKGMTGTKKGC